MPSGIVFPISKVEESNLIQSFLDIRNPIITVDGGWVKGNAGQPSPVFYKIVLMQNISIALILGPCNIQSMRMYCKTINNTRYFILVMNETQSLPGVEFCSKDIFTV